MEKKYYKISESEYLSLLENSFRLEALNCGGVDNWDWYGESICDYLEEDYNSNKEKYNKLILEGNVGDLYYDGTCIRDSDTKRPINIARWIDFRDVARIFLEEEGELID